MAAQYQIIEKEGAFLPISQFESRLIPQGAIITWEGSPGPHLLPLNPEAEEAHERWLNEEFEYDHRTPEGILVKLKHFPHQEHMATKNSPAGPATYASVVAEPAKEEKGRLSVAEVNLYGARGNSSGSQRPGPEPGVNVRAEFDQRTGSVEASGEPPGGLSILSPAPPKRVEGSLSSSVPARKGA